MSGVIHKLDIDDWDDLRGLFLEFSASPHYQKLDLNLNTMKSYFLISQQHEKYAILGLRDHSKLVGFCIIYEIMVPGVAAPNGRISLIPKSFILGLYVKTGTVRELVQQFSDAIDEWAIRQGHIEIIGNCRMGLGSRAAGLFGYREKYKVMAKSLAKKVSDVEEVV